ncbi:MAG: hypothetical protein V3V13_06485 [Paracoccaceae bacterium]
MTPIDFFDTTSFWSIWYWILTIIAWSMTAHWTLGVPFDMIVNANKKGGIFAEQCDALIEINIARYIYYFDLAGAYILALVAFVLAAVATLGFYLGIEAFMALFMLILPLNIVMGFTVRFAYRARREGWQGVELRKKIRWRRFWNQLIGVLAITATSIMAVIFFLSTIGYL